MSAEVLLEKEINDLYLKCGLNPSNTIPVKTEINTGTLYEQFETFLLINQKNHIALGNTMTTKIRYSKLKDIKVLKF